MRPFRSLAVKLSLSFLGVGLAVAGLVAIFAGQFPAHQFGNFLFNQNQETLAARLCDYYNTHGSWQNVDDALPNIFDPRQGGDPDIQLVDTSGHVVAGRPTFPPQQTIPANDLAQGAPIVVDGQRVGTLIRQRGGFGVPPPGANFLNRINQALIIATLGAAVLALVLGWLLARVFTRQLSELMAATRKLAGGELGQQVAVRSSDEVGQLAESFNRMSADLAQARDIRRQMTADIAHELRTPLSIILAHAEALRDGVIPPTSENHALLYDEAVRLGRLVEDLRTLSLADAGELSLNRRAIAPGDLLERALTAQAPRLQHNNIAMQSEIAPALPMINADPDRMTQVLNNLIDNALRHTPAGGSLKVQATLAPNSSPQKPPTVQLTIADSGPGIAAEDLPYIFERFYRADKARQRDSSGSGLGLAIAKSIIEAHGGRIWAESAPGAGAKFIIELPV